MTALIRFASLPHAGLVALAALAAGCVLLAAWWKGRRA